MVDVVHFAGELRIVNVDRHFRKWGNRIQDDPVIFPRENFVDHGFIDEFFVNVKE